MKKNNTIKIAALLVFLIVIIQFGCKHELPMSACDGSTFTVTATQTPATLNQNNGTITATATGGEGFKYSLN